MSLSPAAPTPTLTSLADPSNLASMLNQVEQELNQLDPTMTELEQAIQEREKRLEELRQTKRKLMTLRLSLQAMLAPGSLPDAAAVMTQPVASPSPQPLARPEAPPAPAPTVKPVPSSPDMPSGFQGQTFLPDRAFEQADCLLKQRNSLNYELFRAIVFSGGIATTEQIKQYLVSQGIQQPNTGGTFAAVELSDISARVGYLIRKGLVQAMGKGYFISKLGWESPNCHSRERGNPEKACDIA